MSFPQPELNDVPEIGDMPLDLTKEEKLRVTALMLVIRYHVETIIKEGTLYQAMRMDPEVHLRPTTTMMVIDIAGNFEEYLRNGGAVRLVSRDEELQAKTQQEHVD